MKNLTVEVFENILAFQQELNKKQIIRSVRECGYEFGFINTGCKKDTLILIEEDQIQSFQNGDVCFNGNKGFFGTTFRDVPKGKFIELIEQKLWCFQFEEDQDL